ncbi:MAG: carboxypeptidase regulatory-like domain-containing protein, partial [Anaerolineales bacterium]
MNSRILQHSQFKYLFIIALAMLLAACGGAETEPPPTQSPVVPTETAIVEESALPESEAPTGPRTVRYSYDEAGRLVAADYGDTRIDYTYDNNGNLLRREIVAGESSAAALVTADDGQPTAVASTTAVSAGLFASAALLLALVIFRVSQKPGFYTARSSTLRALLVIALAAGTLGPAVRPVQAQGDVPAVIDFLARQCDPNNYDPNAANPPVPGATVTVSGPVNQSATTNTNGIAHFENLPPGEFQVGFAKNGFDVYGWTMPINPGNNGTVSACLNPKKEEPIDELLTELFGPEQKTTDDSNTGGNTENQGETADPVATGTGEYSFELPLLDAGGLLPIRFTLFYAANLDQRRAEYNDPFGGDNFTHNFHIALQRADDGVH